jgi:hypothetical protein
MTQSALFRATALQQPWRAWKNRSAEAVEAAQRVTLSDKSEIFARGWAARTAHIIYEQAGYQGKELEAAILTFVNRVHGNHLTSQRPLLFQGWMGRLSGCTRLTS